jgi:hypothetical protein
VKERDKLQNKTVGTKTSYGKWGHANVPLPGKPLACSVSVYKSHKVAIKFSSLWMSR